MLVEVDIVTSIIYFNRQRWCANGILTFNLHKGLLATSNSNLIVFMFSKTLIFIFSLLIGSFSFGQQTEVLKLYSKKHFSEENRIFFDSSFTLVIETCYNKPRTIDDEYCLKLKISFLDTLKARQQKMFSISKDTLIVKCNFDVSSVWNWEDENTSISGTIKIISWSKKNIEMDIDLKIQNNRRNRTYIYKGGRTFSRWSKHPLVPSNSIYN